MKLGMVIDGLLYALGFTVGGIVVGFLAGWAWAAPLFVVAAFCLYFFRDPDREIPPGPVAVSPADGKVVAIKPEGGGLTRVTVFLNIFDVHVNRAPVGGRIQSVEYKYGRFMVASKEACSTENEQNIVTVSGDGATV